LRASDVTSVVSGPHVKDSAHFDGRAIDVGSIGGAAVGFNQRTWDFLVNVIAHGGLRKIGTLAAIVNNPALKRFAAQHGVELFEDDERTGATGPHLHLEVGP
jgi:hypothetical protein